MLNLTFSPRQPKTEAEASSPPPSPEQPSSPQNEPDSQPSSIADTAPDHFDDLLDAPAGGGGSGGGGTVLPPTMLDKESFHKVFVGVFGVASVLTHLQALKVSGDDSNARAASDALYETILDVPALHFMLEPQGKWAGRIICIGMFVVPMAINVQAELATRTKKVAPESGGGGQEVTIPDFDMSGKGDRP